MLAGLDLPLKTTPLPDLRLLPQHPLRREQFRVQERVPIRAADLVVARDDVLDAVREDGVGADAAYYDRHAAFGHAVEAGLRAGFRVGDVDRLHGRGGQAELLSGASEGGEGVFDLVEAGGAGTLHEHRADVAVAHAHAGAGAADLGGARDYLIVLGAAEDLPPLVHQLLLFRRDVRDEVV